MKQRSFGSIGCGLPVRGGGPPIAHRPLRAVGQVAR